MHRIAIIGAGFSGAATAIHLLTRHSNQALEVVLINRHTRLARGVAYGTHSPHHLLNVPAGRMSLFPDNENDFLEFARQTSASAIRAADFLPRSLYGEYLQARLEQAAAAARVAKLTVLTGDIKELTTAGTGLTLQFAGGEKFPAERAVLAVGNYPPADPQIPDGGFFASRRYVRDPWAPGALGNVPMDQPILLIGTGLTMLDVTLELERRGFAGKMLALSRRGMWPQAHRDLPAIPQLAPPAGLFSPPVSAHACLRRVRQAIREAAAQGRDWRDVIGSLRPVTSTLWQTLSLVEKRRFLRHLQPYWDTCRHRAAPVAAARFRKLVSKNTLTLRAGRLQALIPQPPKVKILWRPRGLNHAEEWEAAAIVNCTGPQTNLLHIPDPLIRSLLERSLLTPDPLGLGLQTDNSGALLDNAGRPSRVLYYTGPLLRARDWECTAVPELRVAARQLADWLVASW